MAGDSESDCKEVIEVNSPQSVKGDPKAQNPWNGTMEEWVTQEILDQVANDVQEILDEHGNKYFAAFFESKKNGKIDYIRDVKDNGTLYEIDGVYYNSHEALNYKWGMALNELGFSEIVTVTGAANYHLYSYIKDVGFGGERYKRVGPVNELNHTKAIRAGHKLNKSSK